MKIRQNKKFKNALNRAHSPVRFIWSRMSDALLGLFSLLIVVIALLTYSTDLAEYTSKLVTGNKYLSLMEGLFNPFRNKHLLLKSGLPIYDIKIRHQQYSIIEKTIEEAKKQGWMSDDLKVWANAQFIYEGESYNVKIRVRGDLPRHWNSSKKSWRVKFGRMDIPQQNGTVTRERILFDRTRQINLIVPIDRDFVLAKFINSQMREKGLLVPRDDFVILRINGVIQGLYYQVEHFDKPLMAVQGRPETTVFAQSDRAKHFEQYTKLGTPVTSDARFDIGTVRRLVERDGELGLQAISVLQAHSLNPTAENFRRARAVLDWEKFQYFRIMTTLCNTNHVRFGSDNLRLFYDPSRGLLEPVPWDVHLLKMPREPGTIDFFNSKGPDALQKAMLEDPLLRLERNRMLWQFIGDGGDSLISKYRKIHTSIRPFAWADVMTTPINGHKMDELKKKFEYNIKRVYKVLGNSDCNFNYRLKAKDLAQLEMSVLNFSGVELQGIEFQQTGLLSGTYRLYEDSNDNATFDEQDELVAASVADDEGRIRFDLADSIFPDLYYDGDMIGTRYWEYFDTKTKSNRYFLKGRLREDDHHPLLWKAPDIKVVAKNLVTDEQIPSAFISQREPLPPNYTGITAFDNSDTFDLEAPFFTREQFLAANREFRAHSSRVDAVELGGKVVLNGDYIIPHGVSLVIKPGADITLKPWSKILCYGGLQSVGTPDRIIKIHADGSGKPFGVLAAIRPPEKVVIKYTDFSGASQAHINGLLFTGGFAVHEGDLQLENSRFSNMISEDGVNLKNGHIEMRNCVFTQNDSDAIDIDFGTGLVENCVFQDIGGDGLDMSGSTISITDNRFERVADKAISVGEKSNPMIFNNLFVECDIAISVKDLSNARVAHATFFGNRVAIEAKRKKPMFGGGSGEVLNSVFSNNQIVLSEDYFSADKVEISHSVSDLPVRWPTNKHIKLALDPSEDYQLDARSISGNGYTTKRPQWSMSAGNKYYNDLPGITMPVGVFSEK